MSKSAYIRERGGMLSYNVPFEQYMEEKITMLTDEFRLKLTEDEIAHMRSLTTEG